MRELIRKIHFTSPNAGRSKHASSASVFRVGGCFRHSNITEFVSTPPTRRAARVDLPALGEVKLNYTI